MQQDTSVVSSYWQTWLLNGNSKGQEKYAMMTLSEHSLDTKPSVLRTNINTTHITENSVLFTTFRADLCWFLVEKHHKVFVFFIISQHWNIFIMEDNDLISTATLVTGQVSVLWIFCLISKNIKNISAISKRWKDYAPSDDHICPTKLLDWHLKNQKCMFSEKIGLFDTIFMH